MKKALVLSGGGAKGAFTAGVVHYLLRDHKLEFDLAIGTSTGALVAGLALSNDFDLLRNMYLSMENKDILKNPTIIRLVNLVKKIAPLNATMKPLLKILSEYYLERNNLQKLIDNGKEFIVTAVNIHSGKLEYFSSNQVRDGEIKPETFIRAIVASCSVPVLTKPLQIYNKEMNHPKKDVLYFDGGVKEFLPLEQAAFLHANEVWAISTHLLKSKITDWGNSADSENVNLIKSLGWTIGSLAKEVEKGDLFRAWAYNRLAKARSQINTILHDCILNYDLKLQLQKILSIFPDKNIDLLQLRVITPQQSMNNSLEFAPAIMSQYFGEGQLTAEKFIKNGALFFEDVTGYLQS